MTLKYLKSKIYQIVKIFNLTQLIENKFDLFPGFQNIQSFN